MTFWEASHISPHNTFSLFLTLYIVSHTPRGFPICEKKFRRFSFRNLWTSNWKIYFLLQKVVTHFFDFIGFMVVKTTGSTSGLTSFLRFWKQCTVARDICDSLIYFFICFANFSGYSALFSKPLKTRYSWGRAGRFEYHKPYELNKMGDDFLMDFSFFIHRFF